jgi:hypothetical protein
MQTLQEEILALKKNPTDANVKQIEQKEKSVTEKQNALEKHCRHHGMTHGKYGAKDSEVKPETPNGDVSVVSTCLSISTNAASQQAGAMTNGDVKHAPPSVDVKMGDDSTTIPANSADAAASAALDEIQFPQPIALNGFDIHQEIGMATSFDAVAGADNIDPFVTPGGYDTANMFHTSTGTYGNEPFGPPASDYTSAFGNGGPFLDQNTGRTGSSALPSIDIHDFLKQNDPNFTTSADDVGGTSMGLGGDAMDMDAMPSHAPVAEYDESVIHGMDK